MKIRNLLRTAALTAATLLLWTGVGWGQEIIAAWTFPTTTGNETVNIAAECGVMSGSSIIYADGTNGSSNWLGTTGAVVYFGGTIPAASICGVTTATGAVSFVNIGSAFNGSGIVYKISLTGYENLILTYDTRGTATGFANHEWLYSTNGTDFTSVINIPGRNVTTFSTQIVDFSSISAIDNQSNVYIKVILSGASGTGNNRFDNVIFSATELSGPDTEAPVPTFVPANGATDVAIDVVPTITFDEAILNTDGSVIDDTNVASLITLADAVEKAAVPFTATIDAEKKVITITPDAALANESTYTITIAPVEDALGNEMLAPAAANFTTIAASTPTLELTSTHTGPYYAGDEFTVTWNATNLLFVDVEAWVPSEGAWLPMNELDLDATLGTYAFTIPADAQFSAAYKIRVKNAEAETPVSESPAFTVRAVAMDLATIRAYAVNDEFRFDGEAIVTFTRPTGAPGYNQKFLVDETAGLLIHDASTVITTPYVIGDGMSGLLAKRAVYNQLVQIVPLADPGAPSSTGNEIVPEVKTLAEITSDDQGKLVKVNGVTFTAPGTFAAGQNYTITDASKGSMIFRTQFAEANYIGQPIPVSSMDLVMLVGQFNADLQLTTRSMADVMYDLSLSVKMRGKVVQSIFDPISDFVDVAGSFNGFGATPAVLSPLNDADYTYTVTIPDLSLGQNYEFKFRINGSWDDATCEFPSGGPNRNYTIWDGDNSISYWYNDEMPYTLSLFVNNPAMGSATGEGEYFANEEATTTAIPNEGYVFESWTDASKAVVSTENPYTFNMPTADLTLTANFHPFVGATINPTEIPLDINEGSGYIETVITWNDAASVEEVNLYLPSIDEWQSFEGGWEVTDIDGETATLALYVGAKNAKFSKDIDVAQFHITFNVGDNAILNLNIINAEWDVIFHVTNSMSGAPIENAEIYVTSADVYLYTNADGYAYGGLPSGVYYVEVTAVGYFPLNNQPITVIAWGDGEYEISLEKEPVVITEFPWTEDFEAGMDNWMILDADGGETNWELTTEYYHPDGGAQAVVHSYGADGTDDEGWLVSPQLNLPGGWPGMVLKFWSYNRFTSWYGKNSVLISTGSGNPADGQFIEVWSPSEVTTAWVETTIDLNMYSGQHIYIAFKYEGEDSHNWYIDDVSVAQFQFPEITPEEGIFSISQPADVEFEINWGSETEITTLNHVTWNEETEELVYTPIVLDTDYSIVGNTLTIFTSFIEQDNYHTNSGLTFNAEYGMGSESWFGINVVFSTIPTITPNTADYDLTNPSDVFTNIVWAGAESITSVSVGGTPLVLDTDYRIQMGKLFIHNSYLSTVLLATDDTFDALITFNTTDEVTLTVTAITSGTINATIDPQFVEYTVMPEYDDFTITWNAASALTGLHVTVFGDNGFMEFDLVDGTDYIVTDNGDGTANLRINFGSKSAKEYQNIMEVTVEASFDAGGPAFVYMTIIETYYEITVNVNPAEAGWVNGSFDSQEGEEVYLWANSNFGYVFVNWTDSEGIELSTENPYIFTMPASDLTINANYSPVFNVSFSVVDALSNPINDAVVTFNSVTNIAGNYFFNEIMPGEYSYTVAKEGYVTVEDVVTVVDGDIMVPIVLMPVGVNTNTFANFSAFPNPFGNKITLSNPAAVSRVIVANIIGQNLMDVNTNGAATIETSKLPKGVYLVTFEAANGERIVRKMVKK